MSNKYWRINAYTNGYQIVVLGSPPEDSDGSTVARHSCDEMGCGSLEHVVARVPVMRAMPELEWGKIDFPKGNQWE
jgi:hypothetical protein